MDFLKSISIAASGLRAQAGRMRIISENIANADSGPSSPGAEPYRRKIPTFRQQVDRESGATVIEAGRIQRDTAPFRTKYDPGNPAANERGEIRMPNVNGLIENMDMREAQRSYEANLNMITATRRMISKTLEILKA